ncbi:MAG: patatin-like phospholipase family protein, partial [Burkholderiaceae bacterium]|nr:patatin-like phospholipase family protein [Burkholderiaceae bacterium]
MSVMRARAWPAVACAVAMLAGVTVAAPAPAAEPPVAGASPRIGLALSGGGARGLAHVGVLK